MLRPCRFCGSMINGAAKKMTHEYTVHPIEAHQAKILALEAQKVNIDEQIQRSKDIIDRKLMELRQKARGS